MKRIILLIGALALCLSCTVEPVSPNGNLSMQIEEDGGITVLYKGKSAVELSSVGMTTTTRGEGLVFKKIRERGHIVEEYEMIGGKKLLCSNEANEYVLNYVDKNGEPLDLVMRLYNDGIAFRYELSDLQGEKLVDEQTTYHIPEGTDRWIQRWTEAYEDFFPHSTTGKGRRSQQWGYPALIEPTEGVFALITEAGVEKNQSASDLKNEADLEEYKVCPATNECELNGDWVTPWRVVIIGGLGDIVESTLVTDVSAPCRIEDTSWIEPGVVSWIYWAYNHGSKDFQIVKKYIDMAETLGLPYVLIDAEWDEMANGGNVDDALAYAKEKGVKVLLWYNSSTAWINGAGGPQFRLNKLEDREKEFAWLESQGVAGVKVDFFKGDLQETMEYCIELIECAARHNLLINFHGATIPRGWQRTYPNLVSIEAVYGAEWYNNLPILTNRAAAHNATIPFTRNVIGPMDYTPCTFSDSQHPHITTHAHELALTVLYESTLLHLADKPESYLAQPQTVQDFLTDLPTVWDETRYISGYPGESCVLARRSGDAWFIAGINGKDEPQSLTADLKGIIENGKSVTTFQDTGDPDQPWDIMTGGSSNSLPESQIFNCQPRGGFVMVIR